LPVFSGRQARSLSVTIKLLGNLFQAVQIMGSQAIAAERAERAQTHYRACTLCEHRCGVDRAAGQPGRCRAGAEARVWRHRVEYGEELELVPSHLFYLSGCNLSCAFCVQGPEAFDPSLGRALDGRWLRETIDWGIGQGARNVQWIGGEPTIHLPAILAASAECGPLPPVVWKSNFFATDQTWDLLDGLVDVYVADFKFGCDACAKRLAEVDNYLAVVTRNLLAVAGKAWLIVRHLLLPGHFDCCYRPIVDFVRRWLPRVPISIREGYLPSWQAGRHVELTRVLDRQSGARARALAAESGLNVIE
jgi:putative pyruvate formate lyase activating enzyme